MIEEDVLSEIIKRKKLADYYYDNFRKYYYTKDFSKASEFLWGSLNALTYALGLFYGEKLSEHKKVIDFIERLASTYKDRDMPDQLASAQRIHANFFHNFMDNLMFETDKKRTETLLVNLRKILDEKLKDIYKSSGMNRFIEKSN